MDEERVQQLTESILREHFPEEYLGSAQGRDDRTVTSDILERFKLVVADMGPACEESVERFMYWQQGEDRGVDLETGETLEPMGLGDPRDYRGWGGYAEWLKETAYGIWSSFDEGCLEEMLDDQVTEANG